MVELGAGSLPRAIVVIGRAVAAADRHDRVWATGWQHDAMTRLRPGAAPIRRIGITGQPAGARDRRRRAARHRPARAACAHRAPCPAGVGRSVHSRSAATDDTPAATDRRVCATSTAPAAVAARASRGGAAAQAAAPVGVAAAGGATRERHRHCRQDRHHLPPRIRHWVHLVTLDMQVDNHALKPRARSVPGPRNVTTLS